MQKFEKFMINVIFWKEITRTFLYLFLGYEMCVVCAQVLLTLSGHLVRNNNLFLFCCDSHCIQQVAVVIPWPAIRFRAI